MADFPLKVLMSAVDRVSGPIGRLHGKLAGLVRPLVGLQRRLALAAERSGLPKVVEQVRKVGGAVGGVLSQVGRLGARLFALGAIGGGIAVALVKRWATAGDEIAKTARKLGVSVETLQELRFAGSREGLDTAALDKGIEVLRRTMGEAALGRGGGVAAFEAIGVSVLDAEGRVRSFESVFEELAGKLSKLNDPALRNAIAASIFGRGGAEMMKLLSQGPDAIAALRAEAHRLGLVMSKEATAGAERFDDAVTDVIAALTGSRNAVVAPVADQISPMLERLREWFVENRPEVERWARMFSERLPEALAKVRTEAARAWHQLAPWLSLAKRLVDRFGPVTTVLVALGAVLGGPLIVSVLSLGVALAGLGASLLALPFGLVLAKIALIAAAIGGAAWLVKRAWKPLGQFFSGLFRTISAEAAALRKNLSGDVFATGSLTGEMFRRARSTTTPIVGMQADETPEQAEARARAEDERDARDRTGGFEALVPSLERMFRARANTKPAEARVRVSFDGLPQGARVRTEKNDGVLLDLDVGRSMLGAT